MKFLINYKYLSMSKNVPFTFKLDPITGKLKKVYNTQAPPPPQQAPPIPPPLRVPSPPLQEIKPTPIITEPLNQPYQEYEPMYQMVPSNNSPLFPSYGTSYEMMNFYDRQAQRNLDYNKAYLQYQDNNNERKNNYDIQVYKIKDKQNERNFKKDLYEINNIEQVTRAKLALNDQAFHQRLQRDEEIRNKTTKRQAPVKQEQCAREIAAAAEIVGYNINNDPFSIFISQLFVEPDHNKPYYSHSYLFGGVSHCSYSPSKVKIYFVENRHKPVTITMKDSNDYMNVIQSNNLNHIALIRCYHPMMTFEDQSFIAKLCPCPDCTIS